MPRGDTLSTCVDRLRGELHQIENTAVGQAAKHVLVQKLRAAQQDLALEFNWPFLRVFATKNVSAGSYKYDKPTNLEFNNIVSVHHKWNSRYGEALERGIGIEQYNAFNPEDNQRSDPVQRWDIRDTGSSAQIEIWPLPATSVTSGLLFIGRRDLNGFNNDADTCDLPSEVIIPWAAADYLGKDNAASASIMRARAKKNAGLWIGKAGKTKNRYGFADGLAAEHRVRQSIIVVSQT